MGKKVNLSISGKQPDITDGDEIKLVTDASYSYINNRHFVKYEEIHEGSVKIKTLIKFDKNSFEISKCGAVNTNMVFEIGKIHKGTYRTPFGEFFTEIETEALEVTKDDEGITVYIRYELFLDGSRISKCHLNMKIWEEKL